MTSSPLPTNPGVRLNPTASTVLAIICAVGGIALSRFGIRFDGALDVHVTPGAVAFQTALLDQVVSGLSIQVSSLFRDPGFYLAFRNRAVPLLKTYPSIRIWHAGCATGEEVYSMAALLTEEDLFRKCRIYGTDLILFYDDARGADAFGRNDPF